MDEMLLNRSGRCANRRPPCPLPNKPTSVLNEPASARRVPVQEHPWNPIWPYQFGACFSGTWAGHPGAGKVAEAVPGPGLEKGALGCRVCRIKSGFNPTYRT